MPAGAYQHQGTSYLFLTRTNTCSNNVTASSFILHSGRHVCSDIGFALQVFLLTGARRPHFQIVAMGKDYRQDPTGQHLRQ